MPPTPVQESNQFRLLATRRFGPLFVTQLLGAFNDNLFKNALVLLVTYQAATLAVMRPEVLVNLCGGVLILPFFLFSATAGQLADKYERSRIVRLVKLLEVGIMLLGAAGFVLHSLGLLLATLFLLGTHSTFFGPVKYALLPQHLRDEELIGGNGLVEFGTFVAILAGTIAGGVLMSDASGIYLAPACAIAVAALGYLASRLLPSSPAPDPGLRLNWNPLSETWSTLRFVWPNRAVFNSLLGISWFWFLGALLLAQLPAYAKDYLGGAPGVVTLLLATFSVGVGTGSLLTERLSGHKVEIGLVPFGSIGITLFALDLWLASPGGTAASYASAAQFLSHDGSLRILLDLFFLGMFGGFYAVPLYALIQSRTGPTHTSRVIAANNILNALFMVVAAAFGALLLARGLSIPQLFLVTAVLNAAVAFYIYRMVPEFLMRFIVWLLIHSVYRLRTRGLEHIPETGPGVVACNHVSFVDALVIAAACRRPIRFIMDHNIFRIPVLTFVFREGRAIPIASAKEDPAALERAYEETARALRAGDLVGIFPEGKLTPDGELQPFRGGIQRIVETTPVPVVPVALRGLWGSVFSRSGGRAFFKWPRGPFSRIELVAGAPLAPAEVTPDGLQQTIADLRADWK
jgi:1-acyl-sn-glycerol-3-phosphate acyltransferase